MRQSRRPLRSRLYSQRFRTQSALGSSRALDGPGGNLTGLSLQYTDLAGKRFGLLREALPSLRRLGILATTDNPGPMMESAEVRGTAQTLGLEVVAPVVRGAQD